ncbi:MAG TPA: LuxR C-terminal-related transcriptional regulator [Candidatus Limnocylindrales bacterium]
MTTREPETGDASPVDLASLSEREREVLDAALSGASARDLATQLSLTEATVRSHLAHIYAKLGVAGRVELLARLNGHADLDRRDRPGEPQRPSPWRRHWRAIATTTAALIIVAFAWWRPDLPSAIDAATLTSLASAGQVSELDVRGDSALVTTTDGRRLRVEGLNTTTVEAILALTVEHGGRAAASAPDPMVPWWLLLGASASAPLVLALVLGALGIRWVRARPTSPANPLSGA